MSGERVNPSPSTSWISWGFSRGEDGVGDRTTEGMRVCPRFFSGAAEVSDDVSGGGATDSSSAGGDSWDLAGSHWTPGLTMRLIVSPSWTAYSFSSLASASALPFSRSRCASAGGARGWAAMWPLMADMESAGDTGMVIENGGLRDLNVIWIASGANQTPRGGDVRPSLQSARVRAEQNPPDDCASALLSSGGGGTSSCVHRVSFER